MKIVSSQTSKTYLQNSKSKQLQMDIQKMNQICQKLVISQDDKEPLLLPDQA
jgi:hypothetical protein